MHTYMDWSFSFLTFKFILFTKWEHNAQIIYTDLCMNRLCFINVSLNGLGELSYCGGFKLQTSGELNLINNGPIQPLLDIKSKTSFNHQVLKLLQKWQHVTGAAIMYELHTQYIFRENVSYISEVPEEFSYIIFIYIRQAALIT